MTVWYHLPTIFYQRRALRTAGLLALCVALITTLLFSSVSHAVPSTTKTINFQGRLLTAAGGVVADGNYNIQFKIYQDGTGVAAGNPDGTLKWTETHINNGGTDGVEIKNGFFSVALGSVNPFGSSVDWDQDTLWLSMNVAGNTAACTTFGTAPCTADGEMLKMKRITATPYAINSGAVGGKTANDLVQLGQGAQTDASNNSSIQINKTGSGNLVQLQAGGTDAFTVNNAGNITLGSATDQSITVATAANGEGKSLTVTAGAAASGSALAGGDLVLQGGAGDGAGADGDVIVKANTADSTGTFQVQNTAGGAVFSVDTTNSIVTAGSIKLTSGLTELGATRSLWDSITPTAYGTYNDAEQPINVGTTFKSDVAGTVNGVKFFNPGGGNSFGTDTGKLWACNSADCFLGNGGTELATVTFPMDTSTGWKTATFSTPISIAPDTYYVVTHYSTNGQYAATAQYFSIDHHNAPLHALGSGTTLNGSYVMNGSGFPENTFGNTNYWVDVAFQPSTDVDRISSDKDLLITSGGEMTVGPTNYGLKLQGSSIDIGATNGGNVTIQGGNATVDNGNGGSLLLSGGAGNGTGANGLVVLSTPTFATTTNDASCYTGGAIVASDCTITSASVNNSAAVMVGFSTTDKTATLPDPIIQTAGRIMYVMAASGSQDFTLSMNGGGTDKQITMRQNTATTLLWNGTDWIAAGGSSSTTLQDAYNNSPQSAGGTEIALNDNIANGGLTIRDSSTNPVNGALLEVKNASAGTLFSVNSNNTEYATDGTVNDGANFTANWSAVGGASITRSTTDGQEANDSVQVTAGTVAGNGVKNKLSLNPQPNTNYRISVYAKLASGAAFTDLQIRYSPDNGTTFVDCTNYSGQTVITGEWTKVSCDIATAATAVSDPYVHFIQPTAAASARTYLIDSFGLTPAASNAPNVQIGSGASGGNPTTLFTVDKAASAPTTDNTEDALLGSMYYDTTIGKLQCYEADGWGACGASPDIFVTLSPEYSNTVSHGDDIGTLSTDLCSDALNINDGSASQPTVCGTNETFNFYEWTSAESTTQKKSLYVTYKLPATFKQFVTESASLMGRTNSADSSVTYRIYRNNASTGLTACSSAVAVSTGAQTSWQNTIATGGADPANCGFAAGDSIVFEIDLTAKSDANAYISNLNFIFSNN